MAERSPSSAAKQHDVHLYGNETSLVSAVGAYLADGFEERQTAVVIATEAHHKAFERELRRLGLDPEALVSEGRLEALDARSTLARICSQGQPVWDRFEAVIGRTLSGALGRSQGAGARAYGEMVDLLWQQGNLSGAIRLEGSGTASCATATSRCCAPTRPTRCATTTPRPI